MRTTYKPGMKLLTQENCTKLREAWTLNSAGLMALDGTSHLHKNGGFDIAGNPRLISTINQIFEGYMVLFAEREASHMPQPAGIDLHKLLHDRAYNEYYTVLLTNRYLSRLKDILGDEADARNLLGLVICEANKSFQAVFGGKSGTQKVPRDAMSYPVERYKPAFSREH